VRERAATVRDWDRFSRVVSRHRVAALAADGLRRAGVPVPRAVASDTSREARRALDMAGETVRLGRAFENAGIEALFVKGAVLAQLAYGELGIKQSWDIDVLVPERNLIEGCRLLQRRGYALVFPARGERHLVRLMRHAKECVLSNPKLGITVELHWRLTDNKQLLSGVDADAPRQRVPIGSHTVPTLAGAPLFAHLCVHGATHGWSRLKWLADLNAFLSGQPGEDIGRLCREAERLGAGSAPAAALLLCHRLFGLPLEARLRRRLEQKPGAQAIASTALHCLAYGGGWGEFQTLSGPGWRRIRSQFQIIPGRRYALSQLAAFWTSGHERAQIELPERLDFLYHLLRLPLLVGRSGSEMLARLRT
jgi:hypothetical protein